MKTTLFFHTDENCRKGCHPVSLTIKVGRKTIQQHLFSVDEPGAWWDDAWNCHVDGCDYPVNTKEAAINRGAYYLGYGIFEIAEAGAFYQK